MIRLESLCTINRFRVTQLQQAGAAVGINFTFKNTSFPSTIRSHALLELAAAKDDGVKQNDVAELLFKVSCFPILDYTLYLTCFYYAKKGPHCSVNVESRKQCDHQTAACGF